MSAALASDRARYSPGLRGLHWLMAVLVALAYVFIEQRGIFERGTAERAAMGGRLNLLFLGLGLLIAIGGGVAANSRLRVLAEERAAKVGVRVRVPRPKLCTDNGAMVAALGSHLVAAGVAPSRLDLPADSAMGLTAVSVPG